MKASGPIRLRLHPGIDASGLATAFAAAGRVRIQPFLDEQVATALHQSMRARDDWRQVVNSGDKVFELDRATRAALAPDQVEALEQAVRRGGRHGFQYRYETVRLPDGNSETPIADEPLAAFTSWMSSGAVRDLLRRVTGRPDIAFADGQGTGYSPGDFLTGHDDEVAGKQRRAAYVLGLTPNWRLEWGGLLLFHDRDGAVSGMVPSFNSLDLFAVPQLHSVSLVTPSAAYRRYSVTGWLRGLS